MEENEREIVQDDSEFIMDRETQDAPFEPSLKKVRCDEKLASSKMQMKNQDKILEIKAKFMSEEHDQKMKMLVQEEYHAQMLFEKKMVALDVEMKASQAKSQYYEHLMHKSQNENSQAAWVAQSSNAGGFYVPQTENENFLRL